MPTLGEFLKEKIKRLDDIPEQFSGRVIRSQKQIFREILKDLDALQVKNGLIILNDKNLARIGILSEKLRDVIHGSEYVKAVAIFAKQFDAQRNLNRKIFDEIFTNFSDKSLYNTLFQTSKKQAVELLSGAAVDQNVDEFSKIINDAVSGSSKFTDMVQNIKDLIEGSETFEGRLASYSKQQARDLFAITDRKYTQIISEDFGIEFYEYSGGVIKDTRDFCLERVDQVWHFKEIQEWGNIQQWQGRARGTDPSTIFALLGGYNCIHILIPVPRNEVPQEVIERAISLGYIAA